MLEEGDEALTASICWFGAVHRFRITEVKLKDLQQNKLINRKIK